MSILRSDFISYLKESVSACIRNTYQRILYGEIIALYCENYVERANKFHIKNAEFLSVV